MSTDVLTGLQHVGSELEPFAQARNWKRYVAARLAPFIGERVLEVGAGIGANIPYLAGKGVREWTSLEPDPRLARHLAAAVAAGRLPASRVIQGTIADVDAQARFDTILYVNVLEHIAEDRIELARAIEHLAPGGTLVVLCPAHQFLFDAGDRAIGRRRRYDAASLAALAPPRCTLATTLMLDSVGYFASLAGRLLPASAPPTPRQIAFWDRVLVTLSRVVDPLTFHRFGKTVVAAWRRLPQG